MSYSTPTTHLAEFISTTSTTEIPDNVLHEAKRTLINVIAVALSASNDPSADILLNWDGEQHSTRMTTVIGKGQAHLERAALVNGYLAHLQDYDDTHFPTILHPSAPIWPAVLAIAEAENLSGSQTLTAFSIGAETACNLAMSVHPWHYNAGWHITGTVGVFGAAAAAANALHLSPENTEQTLGLAGTHSAGVRETFGTNAKALHAGNAASHGLRAAYLVQSGFTGPNKFLEGRRGFWAIQSPEKHDPTWIENIGARNQSWQLLSNGLKPFANGIVSHPLEDAVITLRNQHNIQSQHVQSIQAQVHPLVIELMNRPNPSVGLEGKFSYQHCAAVALVDGSAHDAQFSDKRVNDPEIINLRNKVSAQIDNKLKEEEVHVSIVLTDGNTYSIHIPSATGSPSNPMTDSQLDNKFFALTNEILGEKKAVKLLQLLVKIESEPSINGIMKILRTNHDE
tara:strand:+ start:3651 stop:5012 length:1362 start_codon:yes stop_codon:yes gene_type:complete